MGSVPKVWSKEERTVAKVMTVDPDKCSGCRLCEMACAVTNTRMFDLTQSRIRIANFGREFFQFPIVCLQCDTPLCAAVCPTAAITKDEETGIVKVSKNKCVGCRMCVLACPFGNISFSTQERKAIKCELCDGDPQCVHFCVTAALEYREPEEQTIGKTKGFAERLKEVYKQTETIGKGVYTGKS